MEESISLKDIARMCNVSVSTVSKAMNDRPDISSSKKEEIRRIAKEMNYIPNYMASTLKSKHTRNIGVLLSEQTGQGLCMSISPEFSTALRLLWKRGDML